MKRCASRSGRGLNDGVKPTRNGVSMRWHNRSAVLIGLVIALGACVAQRSHTGMATSPRGPTYSAGQGPVVLWDSGHYNFGKSRNIDALQSFISQDGYVVRRFRGRFDAAILSEADVVVIRLALAAINDTGGHEEAEPDRWLLPTPSAFSPSEIDALVDWTRTGGALLIISEHMPFAGAAAELASAFGIEISNGFAVDEVALIGGLLNGVDTAGSFTFRRADGSLSSHPIVDGRGAAERVDSVATSAGCAFRLPLNGKSLLTLGRSAVALLPNVAWVFDETTARGNIAGWSQGGVIRFSRGRVAVFCDAFPIWPPELLGPDRWDQKGIQHPQFTLNVFHWLSSLLPEQ